MASCDKQNIEESPNACQFVKSNSGCEGDSIVNFFQVFYCQLDGEIFLGLILSVLVLALCFRILGKVADANLSPSLARISELFGISENISGVTLLAFGNGAPDVLASIAASSNENDGLLMSLGCLLGAAAFIICLVVPIIAIQSNDELKIPKAYFLRDNIFLFLSFCFVGICAIVGSINLGMGLVFLLGYLGYVIYVLIEEKMIVSPDSSLSLDENELSSTIAHEDQSSIDEINENQAFFLNEDIDAQLNLKNKTIMKQQTTLAVINSVTNQHLGGLLESFKEDYVPDQKNFINTPPSKDNSLTVSFISKRIKKIKSNASWNAWKVKSFVVEKVEKEEFSQMNVFSKIMYLLEFPINALRILTIPPYDEDTWDRTSASIAPLISVAMIMYFMELNGVEVVGGLTLPFVAYPIMTMTGFFIYCKTHRKQAPKRFLWIFTILSFLMSIFWIWTLVNFIVDILAVIGIVLNIPSSYLGITLLAFGNSLGDAMTNVSIAKMGYVEMAIIGSFSGPLFNLLIGFGIALLGAIVSSGTVKWDIHSNDSVLLMITLIFNILMCIFTTTSIIRNKYKMTKRLGIMEVFLYSIYIVIITSLSFFILK